MLWPFPHLPASRLQQLYAIKMLSWSLKLLLSTISRQLCKMIGQQFHILRHRMLFRLRVKRLDLIGHQSYTRECMLFRLSGRMLFNVLRQLFHAAVCRRLLGHQLHRLSNMIGPQFYVTQPSSAGSAT